MAFKIEEINPKKTAVIVVDMQKDFTLEGYPMYAPMAGATMPKMSKFLDECREKGIYVIYTVHVHRASGDDMGNYGKFFQCIEDREGCIDETDGAKIPDIIAPKGEEIIIKKHRYSGFYNTDLDCILRSKKIDTVAIIGVCTDICCFNTARDAMFYGYDVAFLSDLNGTFQFPDLGYGNYGVEVQQNITLTNIALTTGDVMTSEDFLAKVK